VRERQRRLADPHHRVGPDQDPLIELDDLIQIAGALLILIPFAALQLQRMSSTSAVYLWLNLAGSVVLAVLAVKEELWGFVLLETVWGAVAAYGLTRRSGPASPA
jgi:hypothetical protein